MSKAATWNRAWCGAQLIGGTRSSADADNALDAKEAVPNK